MKVAIKVFAVLKEHFEPEFRLEVPEEASVQRLMEILRQLSPQSGPALTMSKFAIGEEFVPVTYLLKADEEVCVIPPSSGG